MDGGAIDAGGAAGLGGLRGVTAGRAGPGTAGEFHGQDAAEVGPGAPPSTFKDAPRWRPPRAHGSVLRIVNFRDGISGLQPDNHSAVGLAGHLVAAAVAYRRGRERHHQDVGAPRVNPGRGVAALPDAQRRPGDADRDSNGPPPA